MDQDLTTMIKENNRLLHELVEREQENQKKIDRVHSIIRGDFIAKIVYRVIIILVTLGAFVALRPYVQSMYESYTNLVSQVNSTSSLLNNPQAIFEIDKVEKNSLWKTLLPFD